MKVAILGSGGREHAIGWAFHRRGHDVYYVTGNGGTSMHGTNVEEIPTDVHLIIPGSEKYIAQGIADGDDRVFAPTSEGARLEASKVWAKKFMKKYHIPTAPFEVAHSGEELKEVLKHFVPPFVIKADGLAGGKGVIIEKGYDEAVLKGSVLIEGRLLPGVSGPVVVEQYLGGTELSAIAIVAGDDYVLLPFVRDYKRAYDGGKGPNTGGMGAVGPIEINNDTLKGIHDIFRKTLTGLKEEGIYYRGFLYVGLMISNGVPYVLEYNVRLGDPETEVIVAMSPDAFVEAILSAYEGMPIRDVHPQCFATDVVIASEGYPLSPRKGQIIEKEPTGLVFYGGVKREGGNLVVSGGRVFHCIGRGKTGSDATLEACTCAESVSFAGAFFRRDIGKVIKR